MPQDRTHFRAGLEKNLNSPSLPLLLADEERRWRMVELTEEVAIEEPAGLTRREQAAAREARFAALVERQARFVFRVAYAIVRNAYDAEDVVQETFLNLYRTRAWEGIREERAFLARTTWRMAVKKRPNRRNAELDPEMPASKAESPEETAITADWNSAVQRLIDALPEQLRQPLALSVMEELSSREIAAAMGVAEGTVRTRIMRARQILREKLARLTGGRYGQ